MEHIDYKFKDNAPTATVENIQAILKELGVETMEKWYDSGLDHCFTVQLSAKKGIPSSVGKGVTKEFARASAYAEFIERLQSGMAYRGQINPDERDIHRYAPDAKYLTTAELIETGEWMDHIIASYPEMNLSRESIAKMCKMYARPKDERILTVPYYSLFEKKYVYLPMSFVCRMYTANGTCAGNSREEAWVHALSEMMERHASTRMLVSGKAAPRIPEETLNRFPTVSRILQQIRENGEFDIDVFDYSIGNGFPVVSTRIIHKRTQSYRVNVAADPVLEIAIQRTLTETFQGKNVNNFTSGHTSRILNKVTDISAIDNVTNQLRASNGLYTADYFANEITCTRACAQFPDNSDKTNAQLLDYMLELYRQLGKPVYVRNFSFLGFHSYGFVVPGFSETGWVRLNESVPEFSVGAMVQPAYRNPAAASDAELMLLLRHTQMISNIQERLESYGRLARIPLPDAKVRPLVWITRSYACWRLKNIKDSIGYLRRAIAASQDEDFRQYYACVGKYVEMKSGGVADEKIHTILYKFFLAKYPDRLYDLLSRGLSPYDEDLMCCDYYSCRNCKYREICAMEDLRKLNSRLEERYGVFTKGQEPSEFEI